MLKTTFGKTSFSFEIFPPKKDSPVETVFDTLDELSDLHPDFISVTYGAGGSGNCDKTLEIARRIKDKCRVESVVHLPCIYLLKNAAALILEQFKSEGIENILALRGDAVEGLKPKGDFPHASDLISFIRKNYGGYFHISAACYPEKHPESHDTESDIAFLKKKTDCGADHLISQLFYENENFYRFLEKVRAAGITVPVEAGIMPVTNRAQIERMVSRCGVELPKKYKVMMEKFGGDNDAIRDAGIAYAIEQIVDLVSHGVDGIHLYTMNKPYVARKISEAVERIIR
ncbi:methylenetetrahydrofolate reductase [NAD(P)H] [Treponema sp.]|uniref:methylenetetrahydrofolate reductase [NAD(P)H] n=1 Tax=Treponema sp. TaxID=166 RepID=UPI003F0F3D4C